MKIVAAVVAVLLLLVWTSCSAAGAAPLPAGTITISNLQAWYLPDSPNPPTCWSTFVDYSGYRTSTLPQISFQFSAPTPGPPWDIYEEASFVISGGTGTPFVDFARIYPVMFLGDERWYSLSFDWQSNLSGSGSSSICLSSYGEWSVVPGAGQHSGHVELSFAPRSNIAYGSPWFALTVVPEPSSLVALCVPLFGYILARRRSRK